MVHIAEVIAIPWQGGRVYVFWLWSQEKIEISKQIIFISIMAFALKGLNFAGINFRGLLQPRNSNDFTGIYFRGWDFFKNFAIFADQILVMFFLQNGKMKG